MLQQFDPDALPVAAGDHLRTIQSRSGLPEELQAIVRNLQHQQAAIAMAKRTDQPQPTLESMAAGIERLQKAKGEVEAKLAATAPSERALVCHFNAVQFLVSTAFTQTRLIFKW
eukprot:SAG31_NODE_4748_length_2982_cov_1.601110_3_plen_114_part_00